MILEYISLNVKKYNKAIYILAIFVVILITYCELNKLSTFLPNDLKYIEKLTYNGYISTFLFVVVMFMGVMSKEISLTKHFMKIRAELAIIASLLIVPHMYVHGMKLIMVLMSGKHLTTNRIIYSIAGVLALVIMIPLFVTSFNFAKRKLKGVKWKKIQRWSYVFYGLIYVHILFAYLNSANINMKNVIILNIVFVSYTVLKLIKIFNKKSKVRSSFI